MSRPHVMLAMIVAALFLAACGGGSNDSSSSSEDSGGGSSVRFDSADAVIKEWKAAMLDKDAARVVSCLYFEKYRGRPQEESQKEWAKDFERGKLNISKLESDPPKLEGDAGTVMVHVTMTKDGEEEKDDVEMHVFKTAGGWRLSERYGPDSPEVAKQRQVMITAMKAAGASVAKIEGAGKQIEFLRGIKTVADVGVTDSDCDGTGLKAADFRFHQTDMGSTIVYVGDDPLGEENLRLLAVIEGKDIEARLKFSR